MSILRKTIKFIYHFIDKILTTITLILIKLYQLTISPDKWIFSSILKDRVCSHKPHCSEYATQILKRYWFCKWLAPITDRVLSCKPSNKKMYDPAFYRIVFFCSANIWIPFLEELNSDDRFEICWVVTQADKPAWRWMQLKENPIKIKAKELFPDEAEDFIQTPLKINPEKSVEWQNFYDRLKEKNPDFLVVISYGKILPHSILDIPTFGPINVHWSLLPKYRGASPLQSIFLNKEKKSWITIMHMNAWMDTWDIIDQLSFPLKFEWTVKDLITALEKEWPKFLCNTLWNYGKRQIKATAQDESQATICQKIEKSDWETNAYNDKLEDIYAKYRAYAIWPKIWFKLNEKTVIIEELELDEAKYNGNKDKPLIEWKNLNPAIVNIAIKPEWKKAMDWKSFCNGYLR